MTGFCMTDWGEKASEIRGLLERERGRERVKERGREKERENDRKMTKEIEALLK